MGELKVIQYITIYGAVIDLFEKKVQGGKRGSLAYIILKLGCCVYTMLRNQYIIDLKYRFAWVVNSYVQLYKNGARTDMLKANQEELKTYGTLNNIENSHRLRQMCH